MVVLVIKIVVMVVVVEVSIPPCPPPPLTYNAGMAVMGQEFLDIASNLARVQASGGCSQRCTSNYMSGSINITTALKPHALPG